MTRIDNDMDWSELEKLAVRSGVQLTFRVARCQHGYTRDQQCNSCEGGYVDDTHTFANIGNCAQYNGRACVAVSDDGCDVAYIAARYQGRL